jgi:nucleoside 2-deoxyribosyltransferase
MSKIYWAAPLHDAEDRERNAKYVQQLRNEGHTVYVPQEHGVWEQTLDQFGGDVEKTRKHFYELDLKACKEADICIACAGDVEHQRAPSEGMIWEMGFMAGCQKTVLLFNDHGYWNYNLMPEFGSKMFTNFDDILLFLSEEEFV